VGIRVDDDLRGLAGTVVTATPSVDPRAPARPAEAATFRLEHPLGEGGTGVAFFALRRTAAGESPHVVKIFRPTLLLRSPEIAEVSRAKEHGAMQRLNARVPPSPYIVRLTDGGEVAIEFKDHSLELPWIASEYVNGGLEGTTLTERLVRAVEVTGVGFDPERAVRTIRCIVEGVTAIHECGLIHRDIKPDNVLLCGFAETEVAKITDFGVAKAVGLGATFGAQPVGTLGYAAPEQLGVLTAPTSAATDVFSLGVLLYRMLAADEYFRRIPLAQLAVRKDGGPDPRPHLRDAPRLHPELQRDPSVVSALDAVIRQATSVSPANRYPSARAFGDAVLAPLVRLAKPGGGRGRRSATRERLRTLMLEAAGRTSWNERHRPGDDRVVRALAWEPDGRALGISRDGLVYWDGGAWYQVPAPRAMRPGSLECVRRTGAARFLLAGAGGMMLELSESGWSEIAPMGDPTLCFHRAAGSTDETLLLAGTLGAIPMLYVSSARSWRAPLVLDGVASINGLGQLDEHRWVLAGRSATGGAYLALYDAHRHAVSPFASNVERPLLAVASDLDGVAYAVGPGGLVVALRAQADAVSVEIEPSMSQRDISAVAIDPTGVGWAAAQGRVLKRFAATGSAAKWESVHSFDWLVPTIGMLAAGGGVFLATVDGAVLEGRDERVAIASLLPPASRISGKIPAQSG
jgi:serine/threonine protein kinase